MRTDRTGGRSRHAVTPRYLAEGLLAAAGGFLRASLRFLWRCVTVLAVLVLAFGSVAAVLAGYFYLSTVGEVPVLENPEAVKLPQDSTIYDVSGKVIGVISSQRRYVVNDQQMGDNIKNAVVSIEDERFFDHEGIDFIGMARAVVVDYNAWRSGRPAIQQGASTITQQYVRTVWLSNDQSLQRKFKELALAVQLEMRLSKRDILDRYLNTVYFGNGNYGAEAASLYYFGKHVSEVTPYEAAVLASTVNNPTIYDPTTEAGQAATAKRAALVLDKMYQLGYISSATEVQGYKQVPVKDLLHLKPETLRVSNPYYYDYVKADLFARYGKEEVLNGGWQVYTTLDLGKGSLMRSVARDVVNVRGLAVAMADVNPKSGAVNAFLGGWDYAVSNFNLATQGHRQPGSSFKPFVYATAFKQGYRNTSAASNAPITLKDGKGKPWHIVPDSSARTMEQGLAYSDNAMAVRTIVKTGVAPVIATAHDMGIVSEINKDAAIALGGLTYGVSPLEMANAYGTFANGGTHYTPWCIDRITDKLGNTVFTHSAEATVAVNTEIAAMMDHALQGVVKYGTAAGSVNLNRPVAGKTGTTDNHADTWFIGYTPSFTTSVWMGYPNANKPIPPIKGQAAWGGTFTARIWNAYAKAVLKGSPVQSFPEPKGVVQVPTVAECPTGSLLDARLGSLGLSPSPHEVQNNEAKPGTVLSVAHGGDLVPLGSTVAYEVAVQKYAVPNFTGMTPYAAIQGYGSIFALHFSVVFDDAAAADGQVTAQDLASGSLRGRGTSILLTIRIKTPPPKVVTQEVQVPYIPSTTEYAKLQQRYQSTLDSLASAQASVDSLSQEVSGLKNRFVPVVPDVTGMDAALATQLLQGMGYTVAKQGTGNTVASQTPVAGAVPGRSVTLTLGP